MMDAHSACKMRHVRDLAMNSLLVEMGSSLNNECKWNCDGDCDSSGCEGKLQASTESRNWPMQRRETRGAGWHSC